MLRDIALIRRFYGHCSPSGEKMALLQIKNAMCGNFDIILDFFSRNCSAAPLHVRRATCRTLTSLSDSLIPFRSADLESLLDNDREFKLLKDSIRVFKPPKKNKKN